LLAEECPNTTDIRTSSQPKGSRHPDAQTRTQLTQLGPPHIHGEAEQRHETKVDTEAGMLSGVSRKRSIRSNPCWFTEFCKSQCLSHFAAPFIVVRAETSVAESCEEAFNSLAVDAKENIQKHKDWSKTVTAGQAKKPTPNLPPPRPHEEKKITKCDLTFGDSSEVKRCV
jgi:hypothetical protein